MIVRGLRERFPAITFGWEYELRFGSEPAYEALRTPECVAHAPPTAYEPCRPAHVVAADDEADRAPSRGRSRAHVLAVAGELAGDDASTTLAGSSFVELAAAGVGKERPSPQLAADRGIGADPVVAFGDHLTDAAMVAGPVTASPSPTPTPRCSPSPTR